MNDTWHDRTSVRHYVYLTPFGQALGDLVALVAYGLVGGLTLGVVTLLVLTTLAEWTFRASWRWAVLAGLIPLGLMGLVVLRSILALATAMLERILGVDLDQSGEVGDIPSLRLEIASRDGRTIHFLDLDVDRQRLATLARLALAGRLAERDVGAVLNRKQWGILRQRLLGAGYVRWRNPDEPRSGLVLTPEGEALFERLSRMLEVDI